MIKFMGTSDRSVSPEEAEIWYIYEFEEADAWAWRDEGFIPRTANEWRELGFLPKEAARAEAHLSAEEAEAWVESGFSPAEIILYAVQEEMSMPEALSAKGGEE